MAEFRKISSYDGGSLSSSVPTSYGLRLRYSMNGGAHESSLLFDPSKGTETAQRTLDNAYEERLKCIYLSPKYDFLASIQGLANILVTPIGDQQTTVNSLDACRIIVKDDHARFRM